MPSGDFSSNSNSANSVDVGPSVSTNSNGSSTFGLTVANGDMQTLSLGVSRFSSDCGDLANGRYRK